MASRRKADQLIAGNRVKINGVIVTKPFTRVNPGDKVTVDGTRVFRPEPKAYLLLDKPPGYLSTVSDPHGRKTVMHLLPDRETRLYPAGRLDADSEGLLLMTNDGELAYRLTHPRFQVPKTYRVLVEGVPTGEKLKQMRSGLELEGTLTAPAKVKLLKPGGSRRSWLEITIHEGRKRQVKKMCASIGHPVIKLRRTKFALLTARGLRVGHYRRLTVSEIKQLYRLVGLPG